MQGPKKQPVRIGINGFGRIGRMVFRAAAERPDVEIVAVNDVLPPEHLAYLLRHDSVHGRFAPEVAVEGGDLWIDGVRVRVTSKRDPAELDWGAVGVDQVVESTGLFLTGEKAGAHLRAGAKRVLISAPAADDTPVYVFGVNSDGYRGEPVFSSGSCTTNCLAPLAQVVHRRSGIRRGLMTTVHAATATQRPVDGPSGKDYRFGRGILENIIPASTGAAKALGKVLPELRGRLTGMAFRVPVSDVSVVDLTCELERETSYAELCRALEEAAAGPMNGVIKYSEEPLVSTDSRGESCTCVFDAGAGMALDGTFVKLVAWYDNEWGFSCKALDLLARFAEKDVETEG